MRRRIRLIVAGAVAIAAFALGGAAIAYARQGDDGAKLTGSALQRASAAALRVTGGGKVNETEYDSEKGATYEVEVTKSDGSTVDVRLDGAFKVVAVDADRESETDSATNKRLSDGARGRTSRRRSPARRGSPSARAGRDPR